MTVTVTKNDGTILNGPTNSGSGAGSGTDRNGNQITVNGSGVFTDTLGTTALTVSGSGTPASAMTFTYTAPSGANAPYTMSYVAYTVATNFAVPGINEQGAIATNLIDKITLPDGTFYQFTYEQTPSTPSAGACTPKSGTYQNYCVTARIHSVTLPTGGSVTYAYSGGAGTNGSGIFSDGSTATLTRATPDGTWIYAQTKATTGAASATLITAPKLSYDSTNNQSILQFQGIYETQRDIYQGTAPTFTLPILESTLQTASLLQETQTCYTIGSPCTGNAVTLPISYRSVITAVPVPGSTTLQTEQVANYNSFGVPTELDDYAFGSGAVGGLVRQTLITYASLGNINAFRQTVTVKNGAGTTLAQTNYNYDETTPSPAPSGTSQLTTVSGSRGNLTSTQRCTVLTSCSSFLQTTMTYDTAGQLLTAKDPAGDITSFDYTDNYFTDNGSNPPQPYTPAHPTDAFPKTVTPPMIGATTLGYYIYSGQGAFSTDQNGNNSYTHFDSIGRLSTVQGPGQGTTLPWALTTYATSGLQADTYLGITDTTASASCTSCRHDEVALDGLGRPTTQELVSDPEGATLATTSYDPACRAKNASHPYRTTSDSTYGFETPTYDPLGRIIKVTHQDGTYSQTFFGASVSGTDVNTTQLCTPTTTYGLGYPTLFVDEAGKKREFWTDGLGRTIEADEPDSSGNLRSYTCYSFDPLGNLLQIVHGSQTRTYAYDPLSRKTSVTIPELANSSGTNCAVTYSYDNNSNLQTRIAPAPNQTSCTTTVTTTYFHDALNRVTKITYSDGTTPTVQYGYDGTALTGCTTSPPTLTDSNPKGRMTSMCDGSGATSWAHDATGKILTEKRAILSVTKTISYSYNLDGSAATIAYPSNNIITYTVSNAQRLTAAKDVANNVQFATAASYVPPGGLSGVITGQISGGFGGITESHTFNSSLEYTTTKATSTAGTAMDLSLSYNLSGGDNGTVTNITNNADNGRTLTLGYDPLNRISSATTQATSGVDCWGQNFSPDPLANLNTISSAQCSSNTLSVTVDGNNHINSSTTFAYDASGNMTQDGKGTGYSYSFDAESRLTKATVMTGGPYCYVYDGNGLRVAKKSGANSDCSGGTVTKLYWRSISGNALAETDGTGSVSNAAYNEYVFFAGRRVASRNGSGGIFYWFADLLGSTRTITTGSGTGQTPGQLCYDADFTPYGQEISHTERLQTTACPPSYKFTGYERDPETAHGQGDTGVDYAFARYYSSRLGRFLSTDPLGGSIGNLQSHNAYTYTRNNPLNAADPTGLWTCPSGALCHGVDSAGGFAGLGINPSFWDEFDLLLLAFTPTGQMPNPDWWTTGCIEAFDCGNIPAFLDVYGNWGLLSLLGVGGAGGGGQNPCRTVQTLHAGGIDQRAQLEAGLGYAVTEISFAATGDINGFNLVVGPAGNVGISGATLQSGSSVSVGFNGQQLSIGAVGGNILLSQPGSSVGGSVSAVAFQKGAITSLSGNATLYGIPIPWTSNYLKDTLNATQPVISGLQSLQNFLGKCATSHQGGT
jgi:RHS repeat-associated protein